MSELQRQSIAAWIDERRRNNTSYGITPRNDAAESPRDFTASVPAGTSMVQTDAGDIIPMPGVDHAATERKNAEPENIDGGADLTNPAARNLYQQTADPGRIVPPSGNFGSVDDNHLFAPQPGITEAVRSITPKDILENQLKRWNENDSDENLARVIQTLGTEGGRKVFDEMQGNRADIEQARRELDEEVRKRKPGWDAQYQENRKKNDHWTNTLMGYSGQAAIDDANISREEKDFNLASRLLDAAQYRAETVSRLEQEIAEATGNEKSGSTQRFMHGLKPETLNNLLTAGWGETADLLRVSQIADKAARGEQLTDGEKQAAGAYVLSLDAASRLENLGGATWMEKAGQMIGDNMPFLLEMAITGGFGGAAAGAARGLMRKGIAAGVRAGLRNRAGRYVAKQGANLLGAMVGGAATAPFSNATWGDFAQRNVDQYDISQGVNGEIEAVESRPESLVSRVAKSLGTGTAELGSEYWGGFAGAGRLFPQALRGTRVARITEPLRRLAYTPSVQRLDRYVGNIFKWDGLPMEYAEEQLNNIIGPLMAGEPERIRENFSSEAQLETLLGVVAMGGVFQTIGTGAAAYDHVQSRRRSAGLLGHIQNPDIRQQVARAMGHFTQQQQAKAISNIDWDNASLHDMAATTDYIMHRTQGRVAQEMQRAMQEQQEAKMATLQFEQFKNRDTGQLEEVFDTQGNWFYLAGGTIERSGEETADGTVFVVDPVSGEVSQKSIDELKRGTTTPYEAYEQEALERIRTVSQAQAEAEAVEEIMQEADATHSDPMPMIADYKGIDLSTLSGKTVTLRDGSTAFVNSVTANGNDFTEIDIVPLDPATGMTRTGENGEEIHRLLNVADVTAVDGVPVGPETVAAQTTPVGEGVAALAPELREGQQVTLDDGTQAYLKEQLQPDGSRRLVGVTDGVIDDGEQIDIDPARVVAIDGTPVGTQNAGTENAATSPAGQVGAENPGKDTDSEKEIRDENGHAFVLASDGSTAFGYIDAETGLTPAPIRLSTGEITNNSTNQGYGFIHIEVRHGDQIRQAGFKSVEDFVETVARNYDIIKEGKTRINGNDTYLLQMDGEHNNTLYVELSKDGSYWNINSAGVFKKSYARGNKVVYSRHTTTNQTAESDEASQTATHSGAIAASRMNAPTTNKDTNSVPSEQEIPRKKDGKPEMSVYDRFPRRDGNIALNGQEEPEVTLTAQGRQVVDDLESAVGSTLVHTEPDGTTTRDRIEGFTPGGNVRLVQTITGPNGETVQPERGYTMFATQVWQMLRDPVFTVEPPAQASETTQENVEAQAAPQQFNSGVESAANQFNSVGQTAPQAPVEPVAADAAGMEAMGDATEAQQQAQQQEETERDENGLPFVKASDGTEVFGEIHEESGLPGAPIKLSEGFQDETGKGYGLAHIEANHGEQIRNAGFPSVIDFVSFVATNYDEGNIRVGKRRYDGSTTYLLQVTDEHDNTLFVELSKDGSYWNVNSAGIFRKGYSNKKETVVKTEPRQPNNAVSTGSSLSEAGEAGITTPEPNGKPTVSLPKGTETSGETNDLGEKIAQAETETDTNPTEAQKEAGNYRKGHVRVDGFDITIEQPKGSVRSGVDKDGNRWETEMRNTYGYIRGTKGVDGDHIDVFLSDDPATGNVYVIDQIDPKTGDFDEHKVMYGFASEEEARAAYLSNYEPGWQGLGAITETSKDGFKKWIASSHRKTKPFSEYRNVERQQNPPIPAAPRFPRREGNIALNGKEVPEETLTSNGRKIVAELEAAVGKTLVHEESNGNTYRDRIVGFTPKGNVQLSQTITGPNGEAVQPERTYTMFATQAWQMLNDPFFRVEETGPDFSPEHRQAVEEMVEELNQELGENVVVFAELEELPEKVRDDVRKAMEDGYMVQGLTFNHVCYLYAPAITDKQTADYVYTHELAGHKNVEAAFSDRTSFAAFCDRLVDDIGVSEMAENIDDTGFMDCVNAYFANPDARNKYALGREYIAYLTENSNARDLYEADYEGDFSLPSYREFITTDTLNDLIHYANSRQGRGVSQGQGRMGEQTETETGYRRADGTAGLGTSNADRLSGGGQTADSGRSRPDGVPGSGTDHALPNAAGNIPGRASADEGGNGSVGSRGTGAEEHQGSVSGQDDTGVDRDQPGTLPAGETVTGDDGSATGNSGIRYRGASRPAENADYEAEIQSIVDKAKADGTYLKAPNGKPTLLSEWQWAQVRTRAFKNWFGDWEKAARLRLIDALNPISVDGNPSIEQREAEAVFSHLENGKNRYDGREVVWVKNSVGKIMRHKGFDTSRLIPAIKDVFDASVPILSEAEERKPGHKEHSNFKGYHHYVGKISLDGRDYYVRFTLQEINTRKKDIVPNQLHSAFVSDVEIMSAGNRVNTGNSPATAETSTPVDVKLQNFIESARTAVENSSKVVDENGEPLVVFHGTPLRRDQITPNRGWQKDGTTYVRQQAPFHTFRGGEYIGMIFTSVDAEKARSIAEKRALSIPDDADGTEQWTEEGYVYDLFLNVKHPFVPQRDANVVLSALGNKVPTLSFYGGKGEDISLDEAWGILNSGNSWLVTETPQFLEEVRKRGYDGLYGTDEGVEYIACFRPNQLKDAYENTGEFSADNDDIRFRKIPKPQEESASLIAVHNTTEEQLKKSLELGGFPMPSIAITHAGMGHTEFGEISLLFDRTSIDPVNRQNKVYGGDAWTPTFPSVGYKLNEDKTSAIYHRANKVKNLPLFNPVTFHPDSYERHVNGLDTGGLVEHFKDDYDAKQFYLAENGNAVTEYEQHEVEKYPADKIPIYEDVLKRIGVERIVNGDIDSVRDEVREILEQHGIGLSQMKPNVAGVRVNNTIKAALDYAENGNRKAETDIEATKRKIDERIDQQRFEAWLH